VRLLLLGGPKFLGRAVIDAALAGGHDVTLFNRGTTNAELYPELEWIAGDRDGGLDGLRGRKWNAVVDTSGYVPRVVGAGAELLRGAVGHYVFVSSISVYASFAEVVDELHRPPGGAGDEDVAATGEAVWPVREPAGGIVRADGQPCAHVRRRPGERGFDLALAERLQRAVVLPDVLGSGLG
jgi:2'-hydroxyisoflavone reductase